MCQPITLLTGDPDNPSTIYEWPTMELEAMATRLLRAELVFQVDHKREGPIWRVLDDAVCFHTFYFSILFGRPTGEDCSGNLLELEWILLGLKSSCGATLKYIPKPKAFTQFTFDVKHLLISLYGNATTNHLYPDSIFLFIGTYVLFHQL